MQNELIIRKHKKACTTLSYVEDFLISVSAITECTSTSFIASLLGIPLEIMNSAIG